jgi:hypothetical protein
MNFRQPGFRSAIMAKSEEQPSVPKPVVLISEEFNSFKKFKTFKTF